MKLVLRQDVKSLGICGDVVDVKDGFARNYLVPQGFALEVSKANLQMIEAERIRQSADREVLRKKALSTVEQMEAESWTLEAKMNEDGHLFGSISYSDMVRLFADRGFEVTEKHLLLDEPDAHPIKEKGVYSLTVKLEGEVEAKVNLFIVASD